MWYQLLRAVARVAIHWYYRSVEVEGRHRVPMRGPVLLAANHNNALVDALVIATELKRAVRLTAKATLLDHPLTRVMVRSTGVIPLRRAADETGRSTSTPDARRNQGAFDLVVETLASEGMILIFPEGKSHSEPALAPLRSGCARMAVQAAGSGIPSLSIVPVGLVFEDKGRPRSRVFVQFGEPIEVTPSAVSPVDAVSALTQQLNSALHAVTLNFESTADADRIMRLAHQLGRVLDNTRPLSDPDTPLSQVTHIARQLEGIRQQLPTLPPSLREETERTLARLQMVQEDADALGVPLGELTMETSRGAGVWFVVRELTIVLICAPFAMWGRVNHWLPMRAATWLGRVTSRNPDEPAMHTLVAGLLIVLLTYGALALGVLRFAGWKWAIVYVLLLPAAATLDFWFSDRLRSAVRRARGYLTLRRQPARAQHVVEERDTLVRDLRSLADRISVGQGGEIGR